jgi:hypothetical protein
VVCQGEAIEVALTGALDQLLERAPSVVRIVLVEMQVDAQHHCALRARLLSALDRESGRKVE